jgi:hypothetical protein
VELETCTAIFSGLEGLYSGNSGRYSIVISVHCFTLCSWSYNRSDGGFNRYYKYGLCYRKSITMLVALVMVEGLHHFSSDWRWYRAKHFMGKDTSRICGITSRLVSNV